MENTQPECNNKNPSYETCTNESPDDIDKINAYFDFRILGGAREVH